MRELEGVLNERFARISEDLPGRVPEHRVEFSRRMTTSWALIYFGRNLVRLSPYVFLLEEHDLKHGSYDAELDATLKHEAVHAYLFARDGTRAHTPEFHALLRGLGVDPNGELDLGPTNTAYRFVYACPTCAEAWRRRAPLSGNWSCGGCSPGRYDPRHRMILAERVCPWERLTSRRHVVEATAHRLKV